MVLNRKLGHFGKLRSRRSREHHRLANPAEVDAIHSLALENGMIVTQPPTDEDWNVREFHLRHPDGHTFRVSAGFGEEEEE
jgi:uncharacterized glyoxalase superfamily protein PhnB